ncbi:MAG: arylesterase [Pseudomonadota bacterium]
MAAAPSAASAEGTDRFTLVAFGDSLVAGLGLPAEEAFPAQLQAWLAARGAGDVTVVNAGVSGDTTSAGRARLDWSIGPEADAVLLELGANDALRGVPVAQARENLDAMLARLKERGLPVLLAGMIAPGNWGAEYAAAFDAMYPELAAKHDVPLYPFFLEGLIDRPDAFQSDGLHPNAAGVAIIVEAIGPDVLRLVDAARPGS